MSRLVLTLSFAMAFGLLYRLAWAEDRSTFFYQDPRMPLTIYADRLSVSHRNRNKTATFSGNVVVTQGAIRIRCARVLVHYHSERASRREAIDRFECEQDYLHLDD